MERKRLPDYLKRGIIDTEKTKLVRSILKHNCLNTVCEAARCPNKAECYSKNTATFLILGNICTRNCRFCNISGGTPETVDRQEPIKVAQAIKELGLKYAVITSVTRDDLPLQGADVFAAVITETRKLVPDIKIEVLTPDFEGIEDLIDIVVDSKPDVFNHNIETVRRLYQKARPLAQYERSLEFLKHIKERNNNMITKSGLMVGLGETIEELEQTFCDLKNSRCDIVTVGQYMQPSKKHLGVEKYYTQNDFELVEKTAKKCGIKNIVASGLVRSSYKAFETYENI
ncbi:MAG: lipoyl synthase [Clostridium sp.]|nr:lipoyl synthase [Clostridium sp.]